ncbi:MAG: 3-phosphoserine/phosphohydroxythreonine transaminase [Pseudomonadota bacterium]
MARVYNFGAGPSTLPLAVLERAREELTDWRGTGMSVMEISHRDKAFISVAEQAEADLREIMAIPRNYKVLFVQGGATSQFAMVPMNLLRGKRRANYVLTGAWSKRAIGEARLFCEAAIAAAPEDDNFTTIPRREDWEVDPDAAYLHYTSNETIDGVEFQDVPDAGALPLVADMSSNILSRCIDVSRFGLIYAGAQKNLGPAGITIVIVRDDLIGDTLPGTPSMLDYAKHAANGSMLNTPPTFNWYLVGLVLQWIKEQGGLAAIEAHNKRKAEKLYTAIDASSLYRNRIDPGCRSRMNVPFVLADDSLSGSFLTKAEEVGLTALKGHRSVGGMRASIYNAMSEEGVDVLIAFMDEFERSHG